MSEKKVKRIGATKSNISEKKISVYDRPSTVRIISICNQKGGCGKTTTVINVAAGLAKLGQRVLVVDLDSQCNATTGLGIDTKDIEKSMFELLVEPKKTNLEDVILETQYDNLHIAPASIELSEFESRMAGEIGRENRLKKALLPLHSLYDFIILDTPPSLGLLSVNALNAATEVQIALQAHPFAFDGLNLLLETITLIKEELNPKLKISGLVVTMFDSRTKLSREIVDKVTNIELLKTCIFKTCIRQNVKLAEAVKARKSVLNYDQSCTGAEDYLALSKEICEQNKNISKIVPLSANSEVAADSAP
ncbi:AAA family ATPase [Pigmentibacter sp. JX0631]|uniref:ParA family protein n=1 Tax=Pigmentibacter sp. JX0631 TaxID=2976982 RepID=UPI0024693964|nr:AAA family ATPase [Pigmentibacter sp. JX0631]WGL58603.1 AAA family ATPase [Pigmentibacter sp. JX0631]